MLYRKIADKIRDHLTDNRNRILLVDGARQIGKSYIIRYVGQQLFSNYIEINMEEDKLKDRIFANARTVNDFYLALSSIGGSKLVDKESTLVFIDEIQAYDHLLTLLKFLNQDGRYTYIASGSMLGDALKRTPSLPIGSVRVEHMYPLDFEEFLIANGVGTTVMDAVRSAFKSQTSMPEALHQKLMDLFRKYLLVGGMPDAVNTYISSYNIEEVRSIQRDIFDLYLLDATKYEEDNLKKLKIQRILQMIPTNLGNIKKRIVFKDIEDKEWKRASHYVDEFEYLISSGVALEVRASSQPSYPLVVNSGKNLLKLYLNDVGILSGIYYKNNINAVLNTENSINLGALYECVVAQELKAHGFSLFYYDNKKYGEVDFLIDNSEDLAVIPLEVKSGKDYIIHSALDRFVSVKDYNVKRAYVLCNDANVKTVDGITYLPVYYVIALNN